MLPGFDYIDMWNKIDFHAILSVLSPTNIYHFLDHLSRDALLYLSHDLGWGMGLGIIGITIALKSCFLPFMVWGQLNAVKMKLLEPEFKNYQQLTQKLSRMGDFKGVRDAQKQMSEIRKRYGIRNSPVFFSLAQAPFLITWFLSLRYMANLPDRYPEMTTQGFLWFQNLADYDHYYLLPVLCSLISYYNLSISTLTQNSSAVPNIFARWSRYVKYVPFISIPVVVFFPACLNLYWALNAFAHLMVSLLVRSARFKRLMNIPQYLPGSIMEKMNSSKVVEIKKVKLVEQPRDEVSQRTADAIARGVGVNLNSNASLAGNIGNATTQANVGATPPPVNKAPVQDDPSKVTVFTNKPKPKKNKDKQIKTTYSIRIAFFITRHKSNNVVLFIDVVLALFPYS
eukprot:TRINITY_DN4252_c0_g2_i4.p1 TRINITY_DN4252_c0_g2~~TRINITY_DN4252_c0_g2_i4.p1  ORF type:complete len:398 (-),score=65.63 TRINITY_DN4252_c0_g2_i4:169-1362(-)